MIANRYPYALVLGFALIIAACGGDGLTIPREGEPAHITVTHGDTLSGRVNETLGDSVVVQVTDTKDRPVPGATVNFTFPGAQAQATPASVTTNSDGVAWSKLSLGTHVGLADGIAEVPVGQGFTPVSDTFTVAILAGDANGLALVSGDLQSAPVNTALPALLVVQVTDESGNPISGETITWSVIEGGGSVSEATTVTAANGQASVSRTLGPGAGQQKAQASAPGLAGSPVTFTHTATAGSAAGVTKFSGDNQSALAGTELANPLVVQVLDAQQNPIPNRAVTWIVTGGGGSVSSENTTTDAQGHASTRLTLGPAAGPNSVNAVVSGVSTVTFNATGTAGTPSASNSEVTASPTSIPAGSGSSTVTVRVRDASNNPVAGVSVSIASSGTGNTIDPASVSSNSEGVATFTFSSTVAESKAISATAGGVAITDGATIVVQKTASNTRIESDDPDPSLVGQTVHVVFTVTGGGGTPTGQVTITADGGSETCSGTVADGFCDITFTAPGGNRRLNAAYAGDSRFAASTDRENHRVDPLPTTNNPPTAAFTPPNCAASQPCQFTDGSSDSDGNIATWSWTFGDGQTANVRNPANTYATSGSYTVTLTVTDDKGAQSSVTHNVTATPFANPDTYTMSRANIVLTVGFDDRALKNDVGGVLLAGRWITTSGPSHGTLRWDVSGTFDYTPNNDGATQDTFQYEVSDEYGVGNQTTVTINITP